MTEETTVQDRTEVKEEKRKHFSRFIYMTFWCMVGVSLIYGFRLWHDIPVHPSLIPIIGAVFAEILSFTLVIALEHVAGPINIEYGTFKFQGASGPIILWCICFLAIVYGLCLLGMPEVAMSETSKIAIDLVLLATLLEMHALTIRSNGTQLDRPAA
ncbi:MAG: hypothetical protein M3436_05815 [Pseudomonadota bacterium]|nr:hypothetical protein [Pseudomonadota bacterium]